MCEHSTSDDHCEYCGHLLGEDEYGYHYACHKERQFPGEEPCDCGPVYGYFPGGDPRDFTPDCEGTTPEEYAAWKKACAEAEEGKMAESACKQGPGYIMTCGGFGLGVMMFTCPRHRL